MTLILHNSGISSKKKTSWMLDNSWLNKNIHGVKDVHFSLFPFGTQASSDVLNHQFEDILPAMLKLAVCWMKPLEMTQKTTVWNFSVTGI